MDLCRFAPVMTAAEEVNRMDIVLIGDNIFFLHIINKFSKYMPPATPMWNYSVPYPLKQWIDTVVQPGINFSDSGQKLPGQGTRWLTQCLITHGNISGRVKRGL